MTTIKNCSAYMFKLTPEFKALLHIHNISPSGDTQILNNAYCAIDSLDLTYYHTFTNKEEVGDTGHFVELIHACITLEYLRVPANAKRQGLCIVGARNMHEDRLNRLVNEATFMLYAINYQQQIEKYHANIE